MPRPHTLPAPRHERRRRALLSVLALATLAFPACASQDEALRARVGELEQRLKELERESGRQMVRFEDVNDRLNLLTDRVETNRLGLERRGIANPLPVVVATPQGYASNTGAWSPPPYNPPVQPAPAPLDTGYKRLEFQERRELARIPVPDSGARRPEPAPQPVQPVDEGPYEDVVITEEDYQRFVQEEGIPSKGGGYTKTYRDGASSGSPAPNTASSDADPASASGSRAGRRSPQPDVVLDERLPVPDASPAPAATPAPRPVDDSASPMDLYKNALADYRAGRYAEALTVFKRYLDKNPEPDYLDNAYYWIGECSYGLGQHQQAITWFDRVLKETPNGNKVPDAMLKASLAYIQIGKPAEARSILNNLIQTYPSTNAAKIAAERLKELE